MKLTYVSTLVLVLHLGLINIFVGQVSVIAAIVAAEDDAENRKIHVEDLPPHEHGGRRRISEPSQGNGDKVSLDETASGTGHQVNGNEDTRVGDTSTGNNKVDTSVSVEVRTKKVEITVIYECLCPISRGFITGQLLPTYQQLGGYLDVTLLPFGKGNKIQACAVHIAKEKLTAIKIIACMSMTDAQDGAARACVEKTDIKWTLIEACVSKHGDLLLQKIEAQTRKVKSVVEIGPLVVVNGQMDSHTQSLARTDLTGLACTHLDKTSTDVEPCASRRR